MRRYLLSAVCAAAIVPSIALSQGTLSTQGFGYPPGQLSTQASGMDDGGEGAADRGRSGW